MKKIVPLILFVFIISNLYAQNFTGQWKGEFIDKSTSFTGWGATIANMYWNWNVMAQKLPAILTPISAMVENATTPSAN